MFKFRQPPTMWPNRPLYTLLTLSLLLVNSSCMDLRPLVDEPLPADFPREFSLYSSERVADAPWWYAFDSAELNRLQAMGSAGNPDLQAAWARVRQSRALAAKTGAERVPSLSAAGTGATLRTNRNGVDEAYDDFFLGLNISWEADLWGRVQARSEDAVLSAQAAEEDAHAAALSLSGIIAESWVNLLSQKQKQQQLEEQLEINQKLMELMEMRFMMAKASALDVYQQAQTVSGIEGALITVKSRIRIALHQLALLTGRSAAADLGLEQEDFPQIQKIPATGLPTDLLAARPDIRAAGLRLQASTWSVAAARADRLPKLQLDASLNSSAGILDTLLDTWILRLAGSLTGPIFDGGRRTAEVERTMAVIDERLADYCKVVLAAVREVEDALVREQEFRQTLENIDQQLELSDNAYREATWRYINGLSDFLPVLREQVNQVTLQLDRVQAGSDLLQARIALHKALGGSWLDSLIFQGRGLASSAEQVVPEIQEKAVHADLLR